MECRIVAGQLGAFYVEGLDPRDSACMSPFNTKYPEQTPIMQFTGLHDKNGNPVYEGDIVFDPSQYGGNKVVIWNNNLACFEFNRPLGYAIASVILCEVIGNIYENPELLKS